MKEKWERILYGNHWAVCHVLISIVVCAIIVVSVKICSIQFDKLFSIINSDMISPKTNDNCKLPGGLYYGFYS